MRHKYTKEIVREVVRKNVTWAQVCRELGVPPMTGSQTYLKKRAIEWKIDFSHFVGSAFNKGRTFPRQRVPATKWLIKSDNPAGSHRLKILLFRDKLKKQQCEECGLSRWTGKELPLELDHTNYNRNDNRIENLRILCPNCHAIKTRIDRKTHSRGGTRQTRAA